MTKKRKLEFKRPVTKAMFSFEAPLWSGPGAAPYHPRDIEYLEYSAMEAFLEAISEERLIDWAHCCDRPTVRALLEKPPVLTKCWEFQAHERAAAPKKAIRFVTGALLAALDEPYENMRLGGEKEPVVKLTRADERKLTKMLDEVAAWYLEHVKMGAPFLHTRRRFKLDTLDVLEILEKIRPEWLDEPVNEPDPQSSNGEP